ncbi:MULTISPECIES: hypothetical protein [unclassified Bradyrhizobium]|uniref:hypothetical protein n=1 Tax=unclassified Bradyrhizobium TaxID=2631580 RepID=UPI001BADA90E|nr:MULTISPECIES: hypothetical protein [unclassified Bradyrhizobium]MBR1203624.1 hypothetical protein [Bradyrhizobium sp. AUGA SZCCT0124]MBR1313287.1 hypothetical protein [Bradyrhizobium sp. AUGA SZCCT0051]MBR1341645.1 hypothetical protein [Bradyrhizobium sp. AUGA SZCCT0105]MBR1356417.1 hypothetical protein [Bradyrhizobium sp. AUGA SZCCT0045]
MPKTTFGSNVTGMKQAPPSRRMVVLNVSLVMLRDTVIDHRRMKKAAQRAALPF